MEHSLSNQVHQFSSFSFVVLVCFFSSKFLSKTQFEDTKKETVFIVSRINKMTLSHSEHCFKNQI